MTFAVSEPQTLRAAFSASWAEHHRAVFRQCLRYSGGDRTWAEDVTQEVFAKLWKSLPELDEQQDVGGWLYRVAANEAVSRLRKDSSLLGRIRRVASLEQARTPPSPETLFERHQAAARALATVRTLPPRERVVLCMKVLEDRSQREIAHTLSMSEGYVSKLTQRALARVRAAGWETDDAQA